MVYALLVFAVNNIGENIVQLHDTVVYVVRSMLQA
jgi:hypothetical protein